jgi:hypothetical protein
MRSHESATMGLRRDVRSEWLLDTDIADQQAFALAVYPLRL